MHLAPEGGDVDVAMVMSSCEKVTEALPAKSLAAFLAKHRFNHS